MINIILYLLAFIGLATVYYGLFKLVNYLMDTANDLKYKFERELQKRHEKIAVKKFIKEEKEKEIEKAILRMHAEKLREEKALSELVQNIADDDGDDEDGDNDFEVF